jgi:hypothetical protein
MLRHSTDNKLAYTGGAPALSRTSVDRPDGALQALAPDRFKGFWND